MAIEWALNNNTKRKYRIESNFRHNLLHIKRPFSLLNSVQSGEKTIHFNAEWLLNTITNGPIQKTKLNAKNVPVAQINSTAKKGGTSKKAYFLCGESSIAQYFTYLTFDVYLVEGYSTIWRNSLQERHRNEHETNMLFACKLTMPPFLDENSPKYSITKAVDFITLAVIRLVLLWLTPIGIDWAPVNFSQMVCFRLWIAPFAGVKTIFTHYSSRYTLFYLVYLFSFLYNQLSSIWWGA